MIGLLRKRIEILEAARLDDGAGGASLSWTTVETTWAGLRRLASTRDFAGDREYAVRRLSARIRNRPGVALAGRIRVDGDDFEIVSIETDDGKERFLTLICEEARS